MKNCEQKLDFEAKLRESEQFLNLFSKQFSKQDFQPKYTYFSFRDVWETIFVTLLERDEIKHVKKFILKDAFSVYDHPEDQQYCHSDIKYDSIKDINELDKLAWGFLAPTLILHPSDEEDLKLCQNHKYDDYKCFDHYLLLRNCHSLVLLVYDLCCLAWPDKRFNIVQSSSHCFVICQGENVIYDFLYYALEIPIDNLISDEWMTFSSRQDYVATFWASKDDKE
jgi:hypothetical protein